MVVRPPNPRLQRIWTITCTAEPAKTNIEGFNRDGSPHRVFSVDKDALGPEWANVMVGGLAKDAKGRYFIPYERQLSCTATKDAVTGDGTARHFTIAHPVLMSICGLFYKGSEWNLCRGRTRTLLERRPAPSKLSNSGCIASMTAVPSTWRKRVASRLWGGSNALKIPGARSASGTEFIIYIPASLRNPYPYQDLLRVFKHFAQTQTPSQGDGQYTFGLEGVFEDEASDDV